MEHGSRFAQLTGDINLVSGSGAGTEEGLSAFNAAHDNDVRHNPGGRLGRISTRQANFVLLRQAQQPAEEPVNPSLGKLCRHSQGKEGRYWPAAHGGYIAQSAGQAAMSDAFGRLPFTPEMNALEAQVGGHQHLVAWRQTQNRTVIPNAKSNFGTL